MISGKEIGPGSRRSSVSAPDGFPDGRLRIKVPAPQHLLYASLFRFRTCHTSTQPRPSTSAHDPRAMPPSSCLPSPRPTSAGRCVRSGGITPLRPRALRVASS
jgi:hypothetical protein